MTVDAAGTQSALDEAMARTTPGGSVAIPGSYWTPVQLSTAWQSRQLRLVPTIMYGSHGGTRDFSVAAAVIAGIPAVVDALISHRFALDDAPEAFRVAGDRAAGALKVHFNI